MNQAFRESFASVTREQGFEYRDRTKIVPSNNDSAYTFFFIPPQHEDLEWIYKGTPLEGVSPQSTLAMCIRMNNGFTTAGATNRHMKAFEMGHYVERGENGQENYIGGATFLEMYDAFRLGKKIYMYNDIPDGMLKDEIEGFEPILLHQNLDID